jgi:hypothetical protein
MAFLLGSSLIKPPSSPPHGILLSQHPAAPSSYSGPLVHPSVIGTSADHAMTSPLAPSGPTPYRPPEAVNAVPGFGGHPVQTGVPTSFDPYNGGAGDGGGYGGGYYDPETDPGVIAARAAENLGVSQLDANQAEARRQAIIRFGDPALATEAGFGLDPQAASFAQQNYLSGNADLARLDKQHQLATQAVVNALASHGILASGDLGYREGQENQAYGNNVYDARSKVLDYLRGLNETYLDRKNQLRQATVAALQNAAQFAYANPGLYGAGGGGGGGGGYPGGAEDATAAKVGGRLTVNNGAQVHANSAGDLATGSGWGVTWTGPGTYAAVKFAGTGGGGSDTRWVKVGP